MDADNRYALVLVSSPQAEPIDLVEAKLHLRVEHDDDDVLITSLISAARKQAEDFSNLSFVAQTYDLLFDYFPAEIKVPRPPLRSVTSIQYVDIAGATQTLATTEYTVDMKSRPGRIVPAYGKSWPAARAVPNAVTVRYVAGEIVPFTAAESTNILTPKGLTAFANGDLVRLSNSGGALPSGLAIETDYYVVEAAGGAFKLSITAGGAAIDVLTAGTGRHFLGVLPEDISAAIRVILTVLYENRSAGEMPAAAKMFCWPTRVVPV